MDYSDSILLASDRMRNCRDQVAKTALLQSGTYVSPAWRNMPDGNNNLPHENIRPMKLSEKLVKRLREELEIDIPEGVVPVRIIQGPAGRNVGGWVWTINGNPIIGSPYTMKDLVKAPLLSYYVDHWKQYVIEIDECTHPEDKIKWDDKTRMATCTKCKTILN